MEITEHHRLAARVVEMVPPTGSLAANSAYTPHLAQRAELFVYPLIHSRFRPVDYTLLDRNLKSYPMSEIERNDAINNLIADPEQTILLEADGIFLFENQGVKLPAFSVGQTADGAMYLDRVEVAVTDADGFFVNTTAVPVTISPGQTMRVRYIGKRWVNQAANALSPYG
jgi:hypothetical protein